MALVAATAEAMTAAVLRWQSVDTAKGFSTWCDFVAERRRFVELGTKMVARYRNSLLARVFLLWAATTHRAAEERYAEIRVVEAPKGLHDGQLLREELEDIGLAALFLVERARIGRLARQAREVRRQAAQRDRAGVCGAGRGAEKFEAQHVLRERVVEGEPVG